MTQKTLKASVWGAMASILTTTTITIWGELYAPLKNWLAITFTHHWLGKSAVSIAVFLGIWLISYFILRIRETDDDSEIADLLKFLAGITIFASVLLIVFYLYEYFK